MWFKYDKITNKFNNYYFNSLKINTKRSSRNLLSNTKLYWNVGYWGMPYFGGSNMAIGQYNKSIFMIGMIIIFTFLLYFTNSNH